MNLFEQMVTKVTDEAWARLMRDPYMPTFLFYTPSRGATPGTLSAAWSSTDRLASAERLPSNCAKYQLRAWIRERCTRLPILPTEGKDA